MRDKNYRIHQTQVHQDRQFCLYQAMFVSYGDKKKTKQTISPRLLGKFKNTAFNDCGKSNCIFCRNVRRNKLSSGSQRLTIQERNSLLKLKEQQLEN